MDLYEFVNRDLYRTTSGETMNASDIPTEPGNSVYSEEILSGEIDGTLSFTGGFIQSKNFVSGSAGWRLSANGTLEAINATLSGTVTATSGTIGGFSIGSDYIRDAANSMGIASTVTGGDDVRFWAGDTYANRATADFVVTESGSVTMSNANITGGTLTIGNNASIDSSGNATFISVSTLNMKAYTNFEASGRFITNVGGSGSATFGNQGCTIAPGTTATSYCRMLWWITNNVHSNNPTFTCSVLCLGGFTSSDGVAFIGLGTPSFSGSGFTETTGDICGFEFKKTSGSTSLTVLQGDGSGNIDFVNSITTLTNNDSIELYIKVGTSSIKYYYRKNGGSLTLAATLSNYLPNSSDNYIAFASSNKGNTVDFQIQLQCAAYEH